MISPSNRKDLAELDPSEIIATQNPVSSFTPADYLKLAVMAGVAVWFITRVLEAIFPRKA